MYNQVRPQILIILFVNKRFRGRLLLFFGQQFSVFKQNYTYFHILFHPYVFSQNNNNLIKNLLSNGLLFTRSSHNLILRKKKNGEKKILINLIAGAPRPAMERPTTFRGEHDCRCWLLSIFIFPIIFKSNLCHQFYPPSPWEIPPQKFHCVCDSVLWTFSL